MIGVAQNDLRAGIVLELRGRSPLTVACVPTGMNTGVSMVPCAVCSTPARAPVSGHRASNSKVMARGKIHYRRRGSRFGCHYLLAANGREYTRISD